MLEVIVLVSLPVIGIVKLTELLGVFGRENADRHRKIRVKY